MLDKWRSGVFNGEITEDQLNSSWWAVKRRISRYKHKRRKIRRVL
jgi:hypothetical protein